MSVEKKQAISIEVDGNDTGRMGRYEIVSRAVVEGSMTHRILTDKGV